MPTRKRRSGTRRTKTTAQRTTKTRARTYRSTPRRTKSAAAQRVSPSIDTARSSTDWLATQTLRTVNNALAGVERGADMTYRTIQEMTGGKRGNWLNAWRGWATHFNPQDLVNMAQHTAHTWEKDLNRFANSMARTIRKTSNTIVPHSESLMRDARRNISQVYHRVEQSPWMHMAKGFVGAGKQELLNMLDIPSQEEVEQLQRKVNTLEQRLTTLMLRGARNR